MSRRCMALNNLIPFEFNRASRQLRLYSLIVYVYTVYIFLCVLFGKMRKYNETLGVFFWMATAVLGKYGMGGGNTAQAATDWGL